MIDKKLFKISSYAIVPSLFLVLAAPVAQAYSTNRDSPSTCKGARITNENPAPKAEIPELSNFSFVASSNTRESSIAVKIRGQEGEFTTTKQDDGSYLVKGSIPEPITEERYARIDIFTETDKGCATNHHYLVKITGNANSSAEDETTDSASSEAEI
jgi:hypothetical protein